MLRKWPGLSTDEPRKDQEKDVSEAETREDARSSGLEEMKAQAKVLAEKIERRQRNIMNINNMVPGE